MPKGCRPRFSASLASITSTAEAPSDNWLALPAVTVPPSRTGLRLDSPSSVVPGRLHSSWVTVTSWYEISFVSLSITAMLVWMGTISSSNFPAACAAAVRFWLSRAYSSCTSRLT